MKKTVAILLRILRLTAFFFWYIWKIAESSIILSYEILLPALRVKQAIIRLNTNLEKDIQVMAMFNLASMTPGTVCMDISDDRKTIYIHLMYVRDPQKNIDELYKLERYIKRVF